MASLTRLAPYFDGKVGVFSGSEHSPNDRQHVVFSVLESLVGRLFGFRVKIQALMPSPGGLSLNVYMWGAAWPLKKGLG